MISFLLRILFAGFGLWVAAHFVPGISYTGGWPTLAIAAFLLGIVNAIVRPVVFFFTLPITVVTLGLFLLVVNAAMLGLVGLMLKGFVVDGLWAGIFGSLVVGAVSWLGHLLIGDGGERN
jgi:putative membrane protein